MNPFGDLLKIYAERNPQGGSIYYGTDKKETWKEVNDRVNSLANALSDLGVKNGDKGIVMFHNCPEFVESVCALQKLGAIPSPMNYRFVPREIEYQTNHSDSKVFLTEDLWLENVKKSKLPNVENYIVSGESGEFLNYEDLIKEYPSRDPEVEVSWEDTSALIYTGGTTGMPKGVIDNYNEYFNQLKGTLGLMLKVLPSLRIPKLKLPISFGSRIAELIGSDFTNNLLHASLIQKTLADPTLLEIIVNRILPMIRGRLHFELKFLNAWPMFHAASFVYYIEFFWMQTGLAPFVFPKNPKFDPREIMELVEYHKPSIMPMVPTMWHKLFLDVPDIDKYGGRDSFLIVGSGGGIAPAKLKKKVLETFPNALYVDGFGMTETSTVATLKVDSFAQIDKIKDRSVGVPLTVLEARVVDESGKDAKQREMGEVLYKSPTVMRGYYKDEEKTSDAMRGGWFHSGDLGYFDEDGELFIVDRMGEVISCGAEKIYPHEVEEILESNPKVEYAALLGVPDDVYGKIPIGLIKLKEGEKASGEEIIDFCRDKMSGIKRPRFCVFVDEFPLNPAGKIMRRQAEEKFKREIEEGYERWKKAK